MRIGVDVLLLMLLYLLILVEDSVVFCGRAARTRLSGAFREQCRLEHCLRNAQTQGEHHEAHRALTDFNRAQEASAGCCRERRPRLPSAESVRESPAGGGGLVETQEQHLVRVQAALDRMVDTAPSNTKEALAMLEPLLVRGAGGIDWERLAGVEACQARLSACLSLACAARLQCSGDERAEMLAWLEARQRALGRTALCLSGGGSLAMYHMGVCRFLLEQGLMPEVISGVSGGSIIAAFLAIHTDEEIMQDMFVPDIVLRHPPHRWFPPWWREALNFLRLGALVPTEDFEGTAEAYFGTWTFQEAYARTGRPVSIVLSSNFSKQLPACVMLNHMTAPAVTIASAVAASCAAMGIMNPRGLVVKDSSTGRLEPFDVLGRSFADGTFTTEVPKDYLRSCFGVTQFFVSQVNPHVSAFLGCREGVLQTLRSSCGRDLQRRARLLSEYHLLPAFFGRAMCNGMKHLSQDFAESQAGITLFPPDMGLSQVKAAVTNPSLQDMHRYILGGQRMAWEHAPELGARMRLEVAIARELRRARSSCQEEPLTRPAAKSWTEDELPSKPSESRARSEGGRRRNAASVSGG